MGQSRQPRRGSDYILICSVHRGRPSSRCHGVGTLFEARSGGPAFLREPELFLGRPSVRSIGGVSRAQNMVNDKLVVRRRKATGPRSKQGCRTCRYVLSLGTLLPAPIWWRTSLSYHFSGARVEVLTCSVSDADIDGPHAESGESNATSTSPRARNVQAQGDGVSGSRNLRSKKQAAVWVIRLLHPCSSTISCRVHL